jgi:hypothetical protein
LGVALGVGLTWAELGPYSLAPPGIDLGDPDSSGVDWQKPHPRAVVIDSDTFNFGYMELDTKGFHTFEVRNEGEAPLTLIKGSTTCKCTLSELLNDHVLPGESAKVKLEWTAAGSSGMFRHHAMIKTNDPRRPYITLTIEGHISRSHKVTPRELVFSTLDVGKGATGEAYLYAYDSDKFEVTSHEFVQADTAEHFELQIEDMPPEQLAKEDHAKAGKIIRLVIKPGLPLGDIRQRIRLLLNLPGEPMVEIPIEGRVIGDIAIVGPKAWDDERGAVSLGVVKSQEGKNSAGMYLLAKGEHRNNLKLEVREARPSFLKIEFEKPEPLPDQEVVKIPFTISVPPGAPIGEHNATFDAPPGKIELDTGHPTTPRLVIYVLFSVEE